MFLRTALIALVILEALFVGTTRDITGSNTPQTNPAFWPGCCFEQSYPGILEPGSSGIWNVTVFPRYGWNQYGVEVTPLPMIETLAQDRIVGSLGFSPTTALLGNVTDVFKKATFTLSVPTTAVAGYYSHTTIIRYKTFEGVTQAYNYTSPVKISALLDPKMLNIGGALNSSFLEVSLKTTNGRPAANAVVELCGFKANAYGQDLLVLDASPTDPQGLARFPAQEVKGLTSVLVEYTHSHWLCQGRIGTTSDYVGASVDLPARAGPLPNIIVALSSSFAVISLATFWSVRRNRQTTLSQEHPQSLSTRVGPWAVPVLGIMGGLWGLVNSFVLAFASAMACQQGICPMFPVFEGLFFLAMFGCSLAALVASGLTLIFRQVGSLSLLLVGCTMWTIAILYYATLPEYWLSSDGYQVSAALFYSVWIVPLIGAGLLGLDKACKVRTL